MNRKTFSSQTDLRSIVCMMHNATIALNTAINGKNQVIHPGAILVFCSILEDTLSKMRELGEKCEKADLESFVQEQEEATP